MQIYLIWCLVSIWACRWTFKVSVAINHTRCQLLAYIGQSTGYQLQNLNNYLYQPKMPIQMHTETICLSVKKVNESKWDNPFHESFQGPKESRVLTFALINICSMHNGEFTSISWVVHLFWSDLILGCFHMSYLTFPGARYGAGAGTCPITQHLQGFWRGCWIVAHVIFLELGAQVLFWLLTLFPPLTAHCTLLQKPRGTRVTFPGDINYWQDKGHWEEQRHPTHHYFVEWHVVLLRSWRD